MRCKFWWIATALLVVCATAVQIVQAEEPVRARVFVAKDATDEDVIRIRDSIIALGGAITGYARGEVFVIAVPPEVLAAVSREHQVLKVSVIPMAPPMSKAQQLAAATRPAVVREGQRPWRGISKATPEQIAKLAKPSPEIKPNAFAKRRSLVMSVAGLPSLVDNSISPHFPPIGEQQWPATCATWAAGYYWSTYTQAADEGFDVSGVWLPRDPPCNIYNPDGSFNSGLFAACLLTIKDPPRPSRATEHIASPAFLYPLVHLSATDSGGNCNDDAGAVLTQTLAAVNQWGVGSWQMKPYDPWRSNQYVHEWPTEAQWIEALPRRTLQTFYYDISNAADMSNLKQHLANGNLAVAGFHQYTNVWGWGWNRSCQNQPDACPGMNNDVLYSNIGSTPMGGDVRYSGHAITIVGYDDNKSYFDAVAKQTKYGAFLIANSAGPDWGVPNTAGGTSNGFFWMSYEFARAELYEVSYNTDRPTYRPRLYAAARLEVPDRTAWGYFYGGVGVRVDNGYSPGWISPYAKYVSDSVLPSVSECTPRPLESDKRLVVDLTDGWSQVNPTVPVPLLFVTFNGWNGGKMSIADFFLDRFANGNFTRLTSPDEVKTATLDVVADSVVDAVMCTDVPQNGDVTGNGVVDRTDILAITSALGRRPQCVSDPRDMDRDFRITIIDARRAVTRCTYLSCQAK